MRAGTAQRDGGFSLVELMTVLAILAILVAVAVASFTVSIERSRRIACLYDQRALDSAIMEYQITHAGAYPAAIIDARPYITQTTPHLGFCPSDSTTAYTYDPSTGEVACPNHPR